MDQQIRDRRVLHQELSVAIRNGELSLYFQPQAKSGRTVAASEIIGFEALARWLHPVRGFVPPSDFIPLAEESGLIVEMGEWILREACREAASWPNAAADRGQPVARAVHAWRPRRPRALHPARNRACARPAGTRNHRGRADRGFRPRPGAVAAAEGARRAHFHGRFRQRLFLAELSAGVPVRQDQDRPRFRAQSGAQSAIGGDRSRRDRARPRPRNVDRRRGCRNRGAALLPRRPGLRRGAGLSDRQAVCRSASIPTLWAAAAMSWRRCARQARC